MDPSAPNTHLISTNGLLPEHNEAPLSREIIIGLLADLSNRLLTEFQHPVRLVVHGGAAMLLHPGLHNQPGCRRRVTRDIDYIHRSFVEEYRQLGVSNPGERLQSCIDATARKYNLGRDWMNAHADVALPMATDSQGRQYDPIYTASLKPNNVHLHTLYTSPGLVLISVTPFWAVALKLVRYQKYDPADITAILRNGTRLNGVKWTPSVLERWLRTECWPMGYESYPDYLKRDMCDRIAHAVAQLNSDPSSMPPPTTEFPKPDSLHPLTSHQSHHGRQPPPHSAPTPSFPDRPPQTHHHGLSRPASMTFPTPSIVHPPHPSHPQHHPQPISRTHSMPLTPTHPQLPPSHSMLSLSSTHTQHPPHPHRLTSSPEPTVDHPPSGAPPPSSLLFAPLYSQPDPIPPTRSHRATRQPHSSSTWPSTAAAHRHPHSIHWPAQFIFSR